MIYTFDLEDNKKMKAIVYEREKENKKYYEIMAIRGVTIEELESIIAQLWSALEPINN